MRLLFLLQKRNTLKVHVMVNKYKKVGWLSDTRIDQMKSWRLYTQARPLKQNKKKNTLLYYRLTKSSSAHVGFEESLEAFLNDLVCHILC